MSAEFIILGVAIIITTVIFIRDRAKKDAICQPKGLFGLVKKRLAYWHLKWFCWKPKLLLNQDPGLMHPDKTGVIPSQIEETVENPRTLTNQPHTADGVSFIGTDVKGTSLLVRFDRRKDGRAEVWLYLRTSCGQHYQLPCHPDTRVFETKSKNNKYFSAGGLRIEPLLAMRRWRISFNGLLRKGVRDDCNNMQHDAVNVKFNLIFVPCLRPYDFSYDVNYEMLSNAIAAQSWGLGFFDDFDFYDTDCYDQWGQLMGTMKIGNAEEEELILRGPRRRLFGLLDWSIIEQYANFHITTDNGNAIYISAENRTEGLLRNLNGYMIRSNNMLCQMDFCDFTWSKFQDFVEISHKMTLCFKAGGKNYTIEIVDDKSQFVVNAGEKWSVRVRLSPITVQMGNASGRGILEMGVRHKNTDVLPKIFEAAPFLSEIDIGQADGSVYVVSFKDLECHQSQVVGGKGLSLALLDKMKANFTVPNGICVTVSAFWKQLRNEQTAREEIRKLQNIAWKVEAGDLRAQCEKAVSIISSITVDKEVKLQLEYKIQQVFGDDYENTLFAVRSSAIGEDSEDTSAAGQNATFLGVQGTNELCSALAKCWASQFSYQSVEYKRHHGQLLNGGMGVAIQKMVPAEVAGVMFTTDPITGNPEFITITANYGLGESVVSAMAEPDTVTVRCTWDNKLSIQDKLIGKKNMKIVMKESGGVEERSLDETDVAECCLSDPQIMHLAEIAKQVQVAFGTPRDIEWAISNGKLYLLQSRPITSLHTETDYEITHELDSATLTDNEYITRGNTGEVLPGASCPLTLSTATTTLDIGAQIRMSLATYNYTMQPYGSRTIVSSRNHVLLSLLEMIQGGLFDENSANPLVKSIEIALLGKSFLDDKFRKISYERFGKPPRTFIIKRTFYMLSDLFSTGSAVEHAQVSHDDWTLNISKVTSSLQLYKKITESLAELFCVSLDHMITSSSSITWNLMVLSILSNNKEDWTLENMSDLSILLGTCSEVISADVPASINAMAAVIQSDKQSAEFVQMTPKEAAKWLHSHKGKSGEAYNRFLKLHAHRCIKEFDFRSVPWGDDPESFIAIIQKLVASAPIKTDGKKQLSISEAIAQIKSPLGRIARLIMPFVLTRSRKAVTLREQTKSILIKVVNQIRKAYRSLGTMMVHEGRIPDEDLVFFFTHHEIGQLIKTRSARLITRAIRRRNMHPTLNALRFPEICIGVPQPLQPTKRSTENIPSEYQIKATPVSPGYIQGIARVIMDVNEAHSIQAGDILVTNCTDIGWSPYFPMLGGIVTEIGGVISHGAVVAREYGLPCIVGATGASSKVQSGDIVVLDANKGTLTKVTS